MDRNLGANRAAISSTDAQSYGNLYQWGRGSDGHQCVNRYSGDGVTTSGTTTTLSSSDTPGNGNFIVNNVGPHNWRSTSNDLLWQGVNGANKPCPSGYRLPTETEFTSERSTWTTTNADGAFASNLKLPLAGIRGYDGTSSNINNGSSGAYWTSTVASFSQAKYFLISSGGANIIDHFRATGRSVRCIKN